MVIIAFCLLKAPSFYLIYCYSLYMYMTVSTCACVASSIFCLFQDLKKRVEGYGSVIRFLPKNLKGNKISAENIFLSERKSVLGQKLSNGRRYTETGFLDREHLRRWRSSSQPDTGGYWRPFPNVPMEVGM